MAMEMAIEVSGCGTCHCRFLRVTTVTGVVLMKVATAVEQMERTS